MMSKWKCERIEKKKIKQKRVTNFKLKKANKKLCEDKSLNTPRKYYKAFRSKESERKKK